MKNAPNLCRILFLSFWMMASWGLAAESTKWQEKMKSLAAVMGELLPELVSPNSDPKILNKGAKALSELTHSLKEGRHNGKLMPPSDSDPSVEFIATKFSEEARHAYFGLQHGNIDYSKRLLRSLTGYCIACHTRHENGPEFPTFPLNPKTEGLGRMEKAELFVATRQFDKGFSEFKSIVEDQQMLKQQPLAWERALRHSLAISVRVKKDPVLTLEILESASKRSAVPEFERSNISKWKKSTEAWKKEPVVKNPGESTLAAEMKRLIRQARSAQSYSIDHSAEIDYLRASATAHDLLRVAHSPKLKAEALLIAGSAYETLSNPIFWPMHEMYYQGCVRQVPHTSLAEECFQRYEQSIYFGYTGSSGTHIPEDVQESLTQLKALASPETSKPKS